jgi:hypothetical protein
VRTKQAGAFIPGATGEGVRSESDAWGQVLNDLEVIEHSGPDSSPGKVALQRIRLRAIQMLRDASAGLHRNPALVVFGNPGGSGENIRLAVTLRKALGFVERLDYERSASPAGYYFHDFGPSDALYTAELADRQKVVLILNVQGRPLWGKR